MSTRHGGVSPPPFDSLNLGFSVGDDPERVAENRRRFFAAAETSSARVVACRQTHGARVVRVGTDDCGRGALAAGDAIPDADALLTTVPGVDLLVQSADCPLVLLAAPPKAGVAVAHSGWRGTAARIVPAAVDELCRATGRGPGDLVAGLAPAIGACCYDVGIDVADAVGAGAASRRPSAQPGATRLALRAVIVQQLTGAGVPCGAIEILSGCTACSDAPFYSHRASGGKTGRFGLVAGLAGDGRRV